MMRELKLENSHKILIALLMSLAGSACRPTSESGAFDSVNNSKITMSLAHPHVLADEDFELVFSTLENARELGLCVIKRADEACTKSTQGYATSRLIYANSKRKFFQMQNPALLDDGLILRVVAFDQAGVVADQRDIELKWIGTGPAPGARANQAGAVGSSAAVGAGSTTNPSGLPSTGATGGSTLPGIPGASPGSTAGAPGSSTGSAGNIVSVIQRNCGGCHTHDQYVSNPESMKSTDSAARIRSGNMPRGRTMSAADTQALLSFLGQ